jgi:hypothetical protein
MKRPILALAVVAFAVFFVSAAPSAVQPSPPAGPTAIALTGKVVLAWQPVSGATAYNVYRGATATSITTLVSGAGVTTTSFSDTTVTNGSTYFYAVRAVSAGLESGNSLTVQAKPSARSCSTGNAVVVENCYPGNTTWQVVNSSQVSAGGIEGFATAQSVNRGNSVDLKVNAPAGSTFRIEVYRTGYYGGLGARLFSTILNVPTVSQPACINDNATGLTDCSNWGVSATLSTTTDWPTGVYLLRLVGANGADAHILLVVRDDSSTSDALYGVSFSTFEAYNNYGG